MWCNREIFKLNDDGSPHVVAGVPPDYFSKTGQLWGNPIYDWDRMREEGFAWWTARFKFNMRLFDIVRLDHFIGFVRNWEVPGGDTHAAAVSADASTQRVRPPLSTEHVRLVGSPTIKR